MYEHRGNGEHPQSLERRRQLLVWRSLAVLILFGGGGLGLLRLVLELVTGAPAQTVVYQLGLLAVNGLLGLLVLFRLRSLRRR
jgi:ABC-type phosphate/phosphonate transport system permease subunit